ncbi:carboxypeptidase-like regulatory domain-containing protein [Paludibaculum fermentans]|uniref:Carboxypeptidase regulatory-like domain-containing protein n=1 Tax=Paludibaculum fermentans TaxID=1473598 RepID=A0A7S7SJI6_PALFE|nr:carboxypeptidase-like regulatory domain-containing protein [Paludibaculum fermentans]QOY88117.1 carboxypeptidase regulatory-like domain-containing protein [Paludibaculum fermentans]
MLTRIPLTLLLLAASLGAQTFHGTLRGQVTDPNNSAVANARVSLTDQQTQVSRQTVSNDQGEYVFTSVNPSTYRLVTEAPGFKRLERSGVVVPTQTAITVDLRLELGQVSEQINVTESTPLLQAADASTGQVIDSQKITDLPILGRNPFYMAKLAQTVVFAGNPKFARMQDQNANAQISIAGGPLRTNNYLVDGISISDSTNRAVIVPSPEAVQELKLQASTYDAEAGRTGGGAFNTLLKSGTNGLHGSAVGHIRQTDWLANDFFANRAGQRIADQPFRDWAGSLGGPVYVPKLYDGRNRTFFFAATEAYRQKDAATFALSVPTALERQGDFSQTVGRSGAQQTIYDPATTTTAGTRTPFAGNVIPADRINSVGKALVSYYPLPNSATAYHGAPNLNLTGSYPNRGDQFASKADHQFTPWLRASASYIFQKTFEINAPNLFGNAGSPSQTYCCDRKIDATQANATLTPTPTTVVVLRWGFNRFYTRSTQASQGFNLASLGLPPALVAATPNPAFPAITMSDVSSFGGGGASQDVFYSRSFNASVSKFQGRHSWKAGFERRSINDAGVPTAGPSSFGFSDVFTRPNPRVSTTGQGSSLATLLLGAPVSGSMNVVTNFNNYIRYYGGFVQDDFRFSPKLTLNFGFRFEYESGIRDVNDHLIVGFDRTAASPLSLPALALKGVVQYAGVGGNPTQTFDPKGIKPGPRLGFAYSANDKTVVRGGYGIFWAPTYFTFQNTIGYSQTTNINASTDGNFTPAASLSNPYPDGLLQPTGNALGGLSGIGQAITITDPATRSAGYVQQISLEVQRQAPAGFVITAGVLGSRSLGLLRNGQNINQLDPPYSSQGSSLTAPVANPLFGNGGVGTVGTANISRNQLLRPFPQFTSVTLNSSGTGTSRYYSYYFRAERRLSQGLSLLASYTWSRSTDDLSGISLAGTNQIATVSGPQNAYDLSAERSLSTQDVPNRFTAAVSYDLPVGRGRPYLRNSNRILDLALGGWSVNSVITVQSGFPLSISQPNNNSVIGASYQRPNATGLAVATQGSTQERLNGYLNPAAFSQSAQFSFGNISRFLNVRGPATRNLDLSIFKTFSIRERVKAQFRAEALNATNTPIFGNPNTTYTSAQFGLITTQVNNPRLVQLGVRATF